VVLKMLVLDRLTPLVLQFAIWQLVVTSAKPTFTLKQLVDTTMVLVLTQCTVSHQAKATL
jgi:hypothetical protein